MMCFLNVSFERIHSLFVIHSNVSNVVTTEI